MLQPIKRKRLYQDIIEQVQQSIQNNQLKPGEKLPSERVMAEALSVSRTSVREAISVMEYAGLVEVHQGKGIFLAEDENDVILNRLDQLLHQEGANLVELIEVREGIEGQAAYLAAMRRNDQDILAIKAAYESMAAAYAEDRIAAEEDYTFHMAVVKAAQNPMLLKAVELFTESFLQGVNVLRKKSIRTGKGPNILAEHYRIYKAIEAQDKEAARDYMWQHLHDAKKRYFIDE